MRRIERRYKAALVTEQDLINCFGQNDLKIQFLGIPEDVTVTHVAVSDTRKCFTVFLWHETFDIVPDNEIIPEIQVAYQIIGRRHDSRPDY